MTIIPQTLPTAAVLERLVAEGLVSEPPLARVLVSFFNTLISPNTIRVYRVEIAAYLRFCGQMKQPPLEAGREHVVGYLAYLRQHGYADDTIPRKIAIVRGFYREAIAISIYNRPNPADNLRIEHHTPNGPPALTGEEVRILLMYAKRGWTEGRTDIAKLRGQRDWLLVRVCLLMALRVSEVAMLRWRDFGHIDVQAVFYIVGKGGHRARAPITPALERRIKAWRTALSGAGIPTEAEDAVFPALGHGWPSRTPRPNSVVRPMSTRSVFTIVDRMLAQALGKNDHRTSPHLLRRTSITLLYNETHDLALAQDHARHSNPATTKKHYIKAADEFERVGISFIPIADD